jgi:hypothetical protein
MNATNLAIVFAPNLIRPKIETIDAILMNSSNVNKLIYMLIFHYEQMFLGKEVDNDEDDDIALSPHLISLKAAQDKVHGSPSSDVPPPTLQTPPQVPADAAKPVQRRKLGQRGRTHTSSASLGEAKPKKKGHTKEKSGEVCASPHRYLLRKSLFVLTHFFPTKKQDHVGRRAQEEACTRCVKCCSCQKLQEIRQILQHAKGWYHEAGPDTP